MAELFGTDGIRGEVNQGNLKPGKVLSIFRALASYWKQQAEKKAVVVGHDGRLSGSYLANLASAGVQSAGLKAARLGLCSTPALAFLTRLRPTAGGVMISASHNPFYDNGIKPFGKHGSKFTVEQEEEVEDLLAEGDFQLGQREEIGTAEDVNGWLSEYVEALSNRSVFYPGRILVDCANGGASELVPEVFEDNCNALVTVNDSPDGVNINKDCGSLNVEKLKTEVLQRDVDIGFALDGDADRLLAVDEKGAVVNGDVLMYMLAVTRANREKLGGLVITVMSNLGLRNSLVRAGVDYQVVGVGDRQVYQRMREQGWRLGGEQSGHIIDRDWMPTGDGLHTLAAILEILANGEKDLYEWNSEVPDYPQVLLNFEVIDKPPLVQLQESSDKIEQIENKLGEEGRVLVRYSGTEPLVRVMLEGKDEAELEAYAREIGEAITAEINELSK